MAFEQRDNSGSLFKNDKKESDNHPDYTGTIMVGGVEYWLSAWLKQSQNGTRYMSLATKPKDAKPSPQRQAKPAARPASDESDIPFAPYQRGIVWP